MKIITQGNKPNILLGKDEPTSVTAILEKIQDLQNQVVAIQETQAPVTDEI